MAKVSVIIPSYGRPVFLRNSVSSVIAQTFENWELIIVDDNGAGSTAQIETSLALSELLEDPRIRYVFHEINLGGSAARNTGWRQSNSDFICFLDNDDLFHPEKLASQFSILESTDFDLTVCGFDSYKGGKKVRTSQTIPFYENYLIPFVQGKINFASGSTMMVRRKILIEVDGYDESFRRKQDVELMIRILTRGKIHVDDRVLVSLTIDDRSNIPKVEDFKKFQEKFSNKFKDIFQAFPDREQIGITQYGQIELAKVALWNKDFSTFFETLFNPDLNWKNKGLLLIDLSRKFITYYLR